MNDDIEICGIKTNNLKGFDVKLKRNSINLIIGPSGSGKSSLAYDTVAQIGLHEHNSLCNDSDREPNFKVSSYKNMLVTVPIKQLNANSNVRSTIGTYYYYGVLNLEKHMMPDFTLAESFYSDVVCPECSGEKFNIEKRQFKVCKKSIGEVLKLPFSEVLKWLEEVKTKKLAEMSDFSLNLKVLISKNPFINTKVQDLKLLKMQ